MIPCEKGPMKKGTQFDYGALTITLGTSTGVLLALALGTCIANWFAVGKLQTAPKSAILVVSPKLPQMDAANRAEAMMSDRLAVRTYSDSGLRNFIASYPGGQELVKKQSTTLIIPRDKQAAQLITDSGRVTSVLVSMSRAGDALKFPAIPVALMAGLLFACFLRPANLSVLVLASLAFSAAVYKATHACPICPAERALGIPLEWWGSAGYSASIVAMSFYPASRALTALVGLLAAVAGLVQLYLFWTARDLCLPCTTIAFANGSMLVVCLCRTRLEIMKVPKLWPRALCPATALALLTAAQAFDGRQLHFAGTSPASNPRPVSLRGRSLSTIGINAVMPREIVAIMSDYCGVCANARVWLANRPNLPIVKFRLMNPSKKPLGPNDLPFSAQLSSVPRLLFVDHGLIIGDRAGWSNTAVWQNALEGDIRSFLSPQPDDKTLSVKEKHT